MTQRWCKICEQKIYSYQPCHDRLLGKSEAIDKEVLENKVKQFMREQNFHAYALANIALSIKTNQKLLIKLMSEGSIAKVKQVLCIIKEVNNWIKPII